MQRETFIEISVNHNGNVVSKTITFEDVALIPRPNLYVWDEIKRMIQEAEKQNLQNLNINDIP